MRNPLTTLLSDRDYVDSDIASLEKRLASAEKQVEELKADLAEKKKSKKIYDEAIEFVKGKQNGTDDKDAGSETAKA